MALTTLPSRPMKGSSLDQQVWSVWEALLYFVKSVFDPFVNSLLVGSATVLSGNTTLVVTHSLGKATYSALLDPTADPGGRYWVSDKTATQFTINLQNAAPGPGIPFDWMVKAA